MTLITRIVYGSLIMFEEISAHIKNSHWKYPVIFVFLMGLIFSSIIFAEDYATSLAGYQELQTRKILPIVVYAVAFLPQIGQIIFSYAAVTDVNKRWAGVLAFILFLTDWGLDVYYKSGPSHSFDRVLLAGVESFVIYTILSEVMLMLCIGTLLELLGPMFSSIRTFLFPAFGPPKKYGSNPNKFANSGGGGGGNRERQREQSLDGDLEIPRKPRPQ